MKRFIRILSTIWIVFFGIGFVLMLIQNDRSNALFFAIATIIGVLPLIFVKLPKSEKPQKEYEFKTGGLVVEGPLPQKTYCNIFLKDNVLSIIPSAGNSLLKLNVDQLTGINSFTDVQIQEANKSVVGRAAIGGILFGGLGAVVGGMSGLSSKKKRKYRSFLVLNYRSSDTEEIKVLSFETGLPVSSKFLKAVQVKMPQQPIAL